jgi:hypothetical protein
MILKPYCLAITLTIFSFSISFQVKASEPKQQCLMNDPTEYTSEEWLPHFTAYIEQNGRQRHRLEKEKDYTTSHIRFVKDENQLQVGYGLLRKSVNATPTSLKLPPEIYNNLSQLGLVLKILNGYVNNFDEKEGTFTPEKTNIYVPHISFVIQWNDNSIPEIISGGMLKTDSGAHIVFMSGNGMTDTQKKIEEFYNLVYKDARESSVTLYSGDNIADAYIPYALYNGIVNDKWEVFQHYHLAKVAQKIAGINPYTKNTKDNIELHKNAINIAGQFLNHLFKNDLDYLFKNRQDTVKRLLEMMHSPKPDIEEEGEQDNKRFKEGSFKKALEENKELFMNTALRRIQNYLEKLGEDRQKPEITNLLNYIIYSTNPDLLKDLEKSQKFWILIKNLGNKLTCPNPDSNYGYGSSITYAERIKKYAVGGYGSHSEQLFVKLIKTQPQLLIRSLEKIKEDHKKDILEGTQPRFLGIIVDAYSWLDTCTICGYFLHNNLLWPQLLSDLRSPIEEKGFSLPFPHIDSLFRVLAQEQYQNMPADLKNAGGGADYTSTGWDFRFLSQLRYTLATRQPSNATLPRDRVFEKVSNTIISAALIRPLSFWYEHLPISQVLLSTTNRDFTINAINILFLRFPDSTPLRVRKFQIVPDEKSNFNELYQVALPLVTGSLEIHEEDKEFVNTIIGDCYPLRSIKSSFGQACLKKARLAFKRGQKDGWQYMINFARFGMANNFDATEVDGNVGLIFNHIINYYKNKYGQEKYKQYRTTQDGKNINKAINLGWKLAYDSKYLSGKEEGEILKKILLESQLPKPSFCE